MDDLQKQFDEHNHDGRTSEKIKQTVFIPAVLKSTEPQTAANYGVFFVATRPCIVKAVSEIHEVAGSSTPTLQIERLTSTTAPASGTELLLTAFNLAATANTVQRGVLKNIPLGLNQGDRLALKDIGTLTNIVGVTVTVEIEFI